MPGTRKFADMLGTDFYCKAEPVEKECPNYDDGIGPEIDSASGQMSCRKCFIILGNTNTTDDEIHDDDAIDAENSEAVELAFTPEGDKLVEWTPEETQRNEMRDIIAQAVTKINGIDQKFAMYMVTNQYDIIAEVMKLTDANTPEFEGGRNRLPKILSVAAHYMKRLPFVEAMRILGVRTINITKRKSILDNLYSKDTDNPMAMNINSIGQQLGIPSVIISKAIEEYERTTPTNSQPKILALAAAWLFLQARQSKYKITKAEFDKIPNLSRSALNMAIKSYQNLPQS
jgi:hypothetical protein